jgi:hypothetical protein
MRQIAMDGAASHAAESDARIRGAGHDRGVSSSQAPATPGTRVIAIATQPIQRHESRAPHRVADRRHGGHGREQRDQPSPS